MIELCPEPPPPPEGPDPALAGSMGDTSSGSYPVMWSSTLWMKAACCCEEEEEPPAFGAEDDGCEAVAAQRMVVGSLAVAEVESLGARRDRLVGEMGPLRLRPWPDPPGYVKSCKTEMVAACGEMAPWHRTANVRFGRQPRTTHLKKMKGSRLSDVMM